MAGPIELKVILSDSVFLEQEPIHLFIVCRNVSTDSLPLPDLDPHYASPSVEIALVRLDDGAQLPALRLHIQSFGRPAWQTLAPGRSEIQLSNLLTIFGGYERTRWPLSDAIGQGTLAAGRYRLRYSVRTHPESSSAAAEASFRVAPLSAYPEEAALMEQYTTDCGPGTRKMDDVCSCSRNWLAKASGRRLFSYLFYAAGFVSPGKDPSQMLDLLDTMESDPMRRAALLWILCQVDHESRAAKVLRLRQGLDTAQRDLDRTIFATFLRRAGESGF